MYLDIAYGSGFRNMGHLYCCSGVDVQFSLEVLKESKNLFQKLCEEMSVNSLRLKRYEEKISVVVSGKSHEIEVGQMVSLLQEMDFSVREIVGILIAAKDKNEIEILSK